MSWEMAKNENGKILWHRPYLFKRVPIIGSSFVMDRVTWFVVDVIVKKEIIHTTLRKA